MPINFPDSPSNGQEYTSGATTWTYDGTKWNLKTTTATTNDSLPIGAIMWFGNTTTTPPGYIAADGSAVSRTTYASLFAVIGTTYGVGDGSTTFNVPSVAATTGKYYIRYTTSLGTVTTTSLSTAPVGTLIDWPTSSSFPTGWLEADGSAVSRTSYADLFSLIGTDYGVGDGSSTFNLPNFVSAGAPVKIIKASLGGIVEPSTVAHASSHEFGGSDVVTVDSRQVDYSAVGYPAYRNVIINGAMNVHQRATSKTSIDGVSGYYTADRWKFETTTSTGIYTQSVENDAPTGSGFSKSLKMLVTTANTTLSAGEIALMVQYFEGQNLQHFVKGTSNAKKFAIQFWVKSNVTGTYTATLRDEDNTRSVSFLYTINASDTWEKKTAIIPADTIGAFDNDNAGSMRLSFCLMAGSDFTSGTLSTTWASTIGANLHVGQTNLSAATNNYWQVTGVQLEPEVVTPFEFEPYETTLRKCMRYYWRFKYADNIHICNGTMWSATAAYGVLTFPVTLRAAATLASAASGTNYYYFDRNGTSDFFNSLVFDTAGTNTVRIANTTEISGTAGHSGWFVLANSGAYIEIGAEL